MESADREREETIAYLEHEGPRWVELRNRCERTANLDRALTNQRDWAMQRIDHLPEEFFAQNVMLELEASHELAV